MHTIDTARVHLRNWAPDDLDALAALHADPQVAHWLGGALNRKQSQALLHAMIAHTQQHSWGMYAVCLKGTDAPIGAAGLARIKAGMPIAGIEAAWRLRPEHWGHGYITEAMHAVLNQAQHVHGITDVFSYTAASNQRSQAVMQRLGFIAEPEQDFDHPQLASDHPLCRHVVYRWALHQCVPFSPEGGKRLDVLEHPGGPGPCPNDPGPIQIFGE